MKEFILKRKKLFIIIGISILFIIILGLILTSKPVVNKFEMYKFKKIVNKGVETGELYYSENKDNLKDLTINLPEENIIKEKSLNGKLVVTKDGKTALAIHDNKYCAIKSVDEEEIKINSDIENCVMPKTSISELNVNLESENECIKYNEKCANGTLVNVKVNENDTYDFYVINDTGDKLTLILNKNLGSTISWITESDYNASGGTNYGTFGNNEKGPITALNTLKTLTNNWTNVLDNEYIISGIGNDGKTKIYDDITMNIKARLLTYQEAINLGCSMKSSSCPEYLYSNLSGLNTTDIPAGYWTSTADATNSNIALYINYNGNVYNNVSLTFATARGIRPVITIEK